MGYPIRQIISARWLAVAICALVVSCGSESRDNQKAQDSTWVDPNQLKPGPVRHEQLTPQQLQRIRRLQTVFAEVDSSPLEKWENDFKRDDDPDREIAIWEAMASAYEIFCTNRTTSIDAKKDVYTITLMRSAAPESEVLKHVQLKVLSREDALVVLKGFTSPPQRIRVSK
jgi:hypothetical protein